MVNQHFYLNSLIHSGKVDSNKGNIKYIQRDNVMRLLANQMYGYCWDDEAINSGYKRDFQQKGQNELIKIVTNYRDNFNIYGSALPFFYNLDKALRELIFMHIHIIRRGLAVIFLPLEGQIHTQDPWDSVTNKKIEARENSRLEKNPEAKFRYHKLTTFAGYIYFGPMTKKQELKYDKIKRFKRQQHFKEVEDVNKIRTLDQKLYDSLIEGKLTRIGLVNICHMEGKKYNNVLTMLNHRLKDDGVVDKTPSDYFQKIKGYEDNSKPMQAITDLVPEI